MRRCAIRRSLAAFVAALAVASAVTFAVTPRAGWTQSRPPTPDTPPVTTTWAHTPSLPKRADTHTPALPTRLPNGAVLVTYEIRFETLARLIITAYDTGNEVFLPLDTVCATLGLTCAMDTTRRRLDVAGRAHSSRDEELFLVQSTPYAALTLLTRATRTRIHVDRDDAVMTMSGLGALPIGRRAARTALRARERLLLQRDEDTARELLRDGALDPHGNTPTPPRWGGLILDYAVTTHEAWGWRPDYTLGIATAFAGGSLIARTTLDDRAPWHTGLSWQGAWPFGAQMTQLRIGEGETIGLATIPTQGVAFTNAPLFRSDIVSTMPMLGVLPTTWSIDAYRDGGLIAFDSVQGTAPGGYTLPVPMRYGENPVTLVAYGPNGEVEHIQRMVRILPTMLPTRQLEYSGATGRCTNRPCAWMSNMDLRYGIAPRWSLRAGATEYFFRDTPTTVHPYLSLSALPVDGFSVEADAVRHVYTRTAVYLDPMVGLSLMSDYTRYATTPAAAVLTASPGATVWLSALRVTPRERARWLAFETHAVRITGARGRHTFVGTGTAMTTWGATLRPYLRLGWERAVRSTTYGTDAMLFPAAWGMRRLKGYWLGGSLEWMARDGWSRTELRVTQLHGTRFSTTMGLVWQRHNPGPRLLFSLGSNLGAFRANTNATAISARGANTTSFSNTVSGSVRWDDQLRRLRPSPDARINRGGVSGVVFLDRNGNGLRDPGDSVLAGVLVRVNGYATTTNRAGAYDAWGAPPMEMASVTIDTTTLTSPWWVPTVNVSRARVVPNTPVTLDIPVTIGGGFDGQVIWDRMPPDARRLTPASLRLTLTNVRTGATHDIQTFADGTIYQELLPRGEYRVTADPDVLRPLGLVVEPVTVTIAPERMTRDVRVVIRANPTRD